MSIGERLKDERERLKMSQTKLGKLGGVVKKTQFSYEQGKTYPHAKYLAAIADEGIDILYIVIGGKEIALRTIIVSDSSHSPERLALGTQQNYHSVHENAHSHPRTSQDGENGTYASNAVFVPGIKTSPNLAPYSVIDWPQLRQVLAGMEAFLEDEHLTLKPDKKASLILILYARFSEDRNVDNARFNDFIKAAMATI